jgi:hypothetical protein
MTYNRKRLVAGLLLLLVVASGANYYLNLGFIPRFAKLLMMFVVLATLVYIVRFGPTRDEMERHRNRKTTELLSGVGRRHAAAVRDRGTRTQG